MSTFSSTFVIVRSPTATTRGSFTSAAMSSVSVSRNACSTRALRPVVWLIGRPYPGRSRGAKGGLAVQILAPFVGNPVGIALPGGLVAAAGAFVDDCDRPGLGIERQGVLRYGHDLPPGCAHDLAHDPVD